MKCVYCDLFKENSEAGLHKFTVSDGDIWWISFVCGNHLDIAIHQAVQGSLHFEAEALS